MFLNERYMAWCQNLDAHELILNERDITQYSSHNYWNNTVIVLFIIRPLNADGYQHV